MFVDDEAPLPAGEELVVEDEQVVELEVPFHGEEWAALDPLETGELGLGREVQRDALEVERVGAAALSEEADQVPTKRR